VNQIARRACRYGAANACRVMPQVLYNVTHKEVSRAKICGTLQNGVRTMRRAMFNVREPQRGEW